MTIDKQSSLVIGAGVFVSVVAAVMAAINLASKDWVDLAFYASLGIVCSGVTVAFIGTAREYQHLICGGNCLPVFPYEPPTT